MAIKTNFKKIIKSEVFLGDLKWRFLSKLSLKCGRLYQVVSFSASVWQQSQIFYDVHSRGRFSCYFRLGSKLDLDFLWFLYFLRCLHLQDYQDHVELEGVGGNVYALENPYEFADGGKGGNCKQKFQNVSRNETQKNVNYGDKIVHTSKTKKWVSKNLSNRTIKRMVLSSK